MNRSRLLVRILVLGTVALVLRLLPVPVGAQGFFEVVDVPVVEVDVVVTDRRERPVMDLDPSDFTLWIDGRAQEIAFFEPPPVLLEKGASPPGLLVIVFDNNGIEAADRNRVIAEIRSFLASSGGTDDRLLVASIGLSGLEVHQELTVDLGAVDSALAEVTQTATRDRYVADYEALLRDIQRVAGVRDPTQRQLRTRAMTLVSQIQAFSDRARQEAERSGGLLWQLIDGLAGIPGRKSLLFVGGAMSIDPGEALLTALREVLSRTADVGAQQAAADLPASLSAGGRDAVASLAEIASSVRVAFYAVVVGGARRTALSGGSAGSSSTGDSSASDPSAIWSPGLDFRNQMEVGAAHAVLAAATGGFVHVGDRKIPAALERLEAEGGARYTLGFLPPGGSDGELHRIEVEVEGKRLETRYRKSFRAIGWDQEAAATVRSCLAFGTGENPLRAGLKLRPGEPGAEGRIRVPLTLELPLDGLALEPVERTHRAQVSVFLASSGKRFEIEPVRKTVLPIVVDNRDLAGAMGQIAEFRLELEAPAGTRRLAIGIRDDLVPKVSTLSVDLLGDDVVGEHAGRQMSVGGRDTNPDTATVSLPTAALILSGQKGGPIGLTTTATLEPLDENRWRLPVEVRIDESRGSGPASLDLHVYALTQDGNTVAKDSRVIQTEVTIVPIELPAGRYGIRVAVREREGSGFGAAGMEIEIPPRGDREARWSSQPMAEVAAKATDVAPPVPRDPGGLDLDSNRIITTYLHVVDRLAAGDDLAARTALREFETTAIAGGDPKASIELARQEGRVLVGFARSDWGRLLPLAVLYGDMVEDYRRRRQSLLSENAIQLAVQVAEEMAHRAKDPVARSETSDLLTSLAGRLLYSQRLGRTEELLELAVETDGENVDALLALAAIQEQQGDYSKAVSVLESLTTIDPGHAEGRLRLGINLARIGNWERALIELDSLAEIGSEEWITQVAVQESARIRMARGEVERAKLDLERAAARWPEQPSLDIQLAWLLDRKTEPMAASERIRELFRPDRRAEDSARYRYLDWYTTGLDGLRAELAEMSRQRARELSQALGVQRRGRSGS